MGQPPMDVQFDLHEELVDGSEDESFDDEIRRKVEQTIEGIDSDPVRCRHELQRRVMDWLQG